MLIHDAVRDGDINFIKSLKKASSAVINMQDTNGFTPLAVAALVYSSENEAIKKFKYKQIIEELVVMGVDIDIPNNAGFAPLYTLLSHKEFEVAEFLVRNGANINKKFKYGRTYLHIFIDKAEFEVIEFLTNTECDLDITNDKESTPIANAVLKYCLSSTKQEKLSYEKIIQSLVKRSVYIDIPNKNGYPPLHMLLSNGKLEVAKIMVDKGGDINQKFDYGTSLLHFFIQQQPQHIVALTLPGCLKMLDFFIENKANLDVQNDNVMTPIATAISKYCLSTSKLEKLVYEEVILLLFKNEANLDIPNKDGFTPLQSLVVNSQYDLVTKLLEYGANVNIQTDNIPNLLTLAINNADTEMVNIILQHGKNVEIDKISINCYTPLLTATRKYLNNDNTTPIRKNFREIIIKLLEKGANPNAIDNKKTSCLHYIAFAIESTKNPDLNKSFITLAKQFIDKGADTSLVNENGFTFRNILKRVGKTDIFITDIIKDDKLIPELPSKKDKKEAKHKKSREPKKKEVAFVIEEPEFGENIPSIKDVNNNNNIPQTASKRKKKKVTKSNKEDQKIDNEVKIEDVVKPIEEKEEQLSQVQVKPKQSSYWQGLIEGGYSIVNKCNIVG